MKAIILDVDGVILEWEAPFKQFLNSRGIAGADDESEYKFDLRYNVPYEEMHRLVTEFNSSPATRTLEPFRDAQTYIPLLHQQGHQLIAVTHMGTCPVAYMNRRYNLDQVFGAGVISELYCISQNVSKAVKLAELSSRFSGAPWIEDHPDNARKGKALGYQTFLMDHPHNQNEPDLTRIFNWEDFMEKYANS